MTNDSRYRPEHKYTVIPSEARNLLFDAAPGTSRRATALRPQTQPLILSEAKDLRFEHHHRMCNEKSLQMDFHNFHDGYFDGIRLESDKTATIFLRSAAKRSYTMVLKGVEALSLNGVRAGNIILDLAIRSAREATVDDVVALYQVEQNSEHAPKLLASLREKDLQILELNPSYGAEGLFLFNSFEITECKA